MYKSKMFIAVVGILFMAAEWGVQSVNADIGIIDDLVGRVVSLDSGGNVAGYIIVSDTDIMRTVDEFGNETCQVLKSGLNLTSAAGDIVIIEDDILLNIVIEDNLLLLQSDDNEILRHFPGGEFSVRDVFAGPVGIRSTDSQSGVTDGFIIVEDVIMMYGQDGSVTGRSLVGDLTLTTGGGSIVVEGVFLDCAIFGSNVLLVQTDDDEILRLFPGGSFIIEDLIDGS